MSYMLALILGGCTQQNNKDMKYPFVVAVLEEKGKLRWQINVGQKKKNSIWLQIFKNPQQKSAATK